MADELSSKEQEELILANRRLVPYLVNKLGIPFSEFDDMVSVGTIGLIKATRTFDKSKKIAFATYASKCINNEIFMYLRKAKNKENVVSLNEPISIDKEGNEFTFEDKISDPSDFTEQIANRESSIYLMNIILNYLEPRARLIMLYKIAGYNQEDMAAVLNISQSYISRLLKRLIKQLTEIFQRQEKIIFKEEFSMSVVGDSYKISFYSKDVKNFNKIFSTFLKNLTSTAALPNFQVSCENQRIKILIPAHPESFSFIAQIIQEIDEYSMNFTSQATQMPENNKVPENVETNKEEGSNVPKVVEPDKAEAKESSIPTVAETDEVEAKESSIPTVAETDEVEAKESSIPTVAETDEAEAEESSISTVAETDEAEAEESSIPTNVVPKDPNLIVSMVKAELKELDDKEEAEEATTEDTTTEDTTTEETTTEEDATEKESSRKRAKQVREYMLSLSESFTAKDLLQHFSNFPDYVIRNTINLAKKANLIVSVGRGQYVVNKK